MLFFGANAATYPLYVNGVQVTENTKGDILGDGTMSFDPETMTLTLNGVNLKGTADGVPVIESKYDRMAETLKIVLADGKNNRITTSYSADAFAADGYVTFTGDGSLYLNSPNGAGINMRGNSTTLEFDQTSVRASGDRGIQNSGGYGTLRTNASTITGVSTSSNTCGITGFTWYDPENSKFAYEGTFFYNGAFRTSTTAPVLGSVQILPDVTEYPIKICGKNINSANCEKFKFPGLNSGSVTLYNEDDKYTLVLFDADITLPAGQKNAIEYYSSSTAELNKPLVIELGEKNKIDLSDEDNAIAIRGSSTTVGDLTITNGIGGSSLSITGHGYGSRGLYSTGQAITLKNLTLDIHLDGGACGGILAYNQPLTIDRSSITITGGEGPAGCNILEHVSEFTLTRAEITSHPGAYYDTSTSKMRTADGADLYAFASEPFVISPEQSYYLSIAGKEVTSMNYRDLPTLLGSDILTNGYITFDPASNTLTLDGAYLKVPDDKDVSTLMYYGNKELIINCVHDRGEGYSTLMATSKSITTSCIAAFGPIKFTGSGGLLVAAQLCSFVDNIGQKGIEVWGVNNVTFDRCETVIVNGGIHHNNSTSNSELIINNSSKLLIGQETLKTHAAVKGFKNVTLTGCVATSSLEEEDNGVYTGDVTYAYDTESRTFVDEAGDACYMIVIYWTPLLGDVNNDREVDITDVVAIANFVMGSTPANFVEANADINGQDGVDITDVVKLANTVMGL